MWKKIPHLDWCKSVYIINLIRNMCYFARSPSLVQLLAIKYCSLWPTRFKNLRRATVYYVWWAGRNEVAFLLWHSITAGHAAHLSIYRYIEKKNLIWSYTSWRQFSVSATKDDGFYAHLLQVNLHAQLGCYVLRLIPEMFFRALQRSWNPVCQLNIPNDLHQMYKAHLLMHAVPSR